MAPANNKKLNISFSRSLVKSTELMNCVTFWKIPGSKNPNTIMSKETITEMSMMPIVPGSFSNFALMKLNKVVITITIAIILYAPTHVSLV